MGTWLGAADQYNQVKAFLHRRHLARRTRVVMIFITVSSALIPLCALGGTAQPISASALVGASGAALCMMVAGVWSTGWPSRRVSLYTTLGATVLATAWSLTQPSLATAALGCTALAVIGGYLAVLHHRWAVLFNAAMALSLAVVISVRVAHDTDVATALAAFWIMWVLNLAAPIGARGLSAAMIRYAVHADEDPLTGLLNRRAFHQQVSRHLLRGTPATTAASGWHLVVAMIDLDDFKTVNDTLGHAGGDQILLRVAGVLRSRLPGEAALCRAGGEEFLLALTSSTHAGAMELTDTLCATIRTHCEVTASIGVACARIPHAHTATIAGVIDHLIIAADHAMYDAKRRGGDRIGLAHPHCT